MFRAWHQHPTFTPTPDNIAICSLLHNISLRGEKQFFFLFPPLRLQPFNDEKKGAHLAGAKDEVIELSVPALPASQAASQTHTRTATHTEPDGDVGISALFTI